MADDLTHLDAAGHPRMVDIGAKTNTDRVAVAEGFVRLHAETLQRITEGRVHKGDVLRFAELAGIAGAKRAPDLIPLCHPIPLDGVEVSVRPVEGALRIEATARTHWRTGVEMEAYTAVLCAALCVVDMVKAIDRDAQIDGVRLLLKRGGRSGEWRAPPR